MSPEGSCLFVFKFYFQNFYVLSIVLSKLNSFFWVFLTTKDAKGGVDCFSIIKIYDTLSAIKTCKV